MSEFHDYEGMKIRNLIKLADRDYDSEAMCELGFRYCSGYDVRPNQKKGFMWLLGAAYLDDPVAQYIVGTMYIFGKGTEMDYAEALYWFEIAAEQGHAAALNELGILYAEGMGVESDFAKAREYWKRAVEAGSEEATANLQELDEIEKS